MLGASALVFISYEKDLDESKQLMKRNGNFVGDDKNQKSCNKNCFYNFYEKNTISGKGLLEKSINRTETLLEKKVKDNHGEKTSNQN